VLARQLVYHLTHTPSLFFALVIFFNRVSHLCLHSLNHNSPIFASHIARVTDVHHSFLLVEMGSCELSAWGGLELQPSRFLRQSSWDYSHCGLAMIFIILKGGISLKYTL
jgi:hypothetical protein